MLIGAVWAGLAPMSLVITVGAVQPTVALGVFVGSGATVALVGVGLALHRRPMVTYVGEDGIAQVRGKGRSLSRQTLSFADATRLFTSDVPDRVSRPGPTLIPTGAGGGVRVGNTYVFAWEKADGTPLLTLSGRRPAGRQPERRGHPYHFARAAERAWSEHLIARYAKQPCAPDTLLFTVTGLGSVRLGTGTVRIDANGRADQFSREELGMASLTDGTFEVTFAGGGRFRCTSNRIANLVVFVWAFNEVVGRPVT